MKIPLVDLKRQYQSIKEEIDSAMSEIIENTSFILGKPVEEFEQNFAKFCNAKYAVGVGNGTDALKLALECMGLSKGDEVLAPTHTFFATVEPVVQLGAKPVLVDADETFNIDVNQIEKKITPKTKAIIPVHIYGRPAEMQVINEIAEKHNLLVLEDCCQSHGAEYKGKRVPISTAGAFSFFPGKNIGAFGDGGAIVTNDSEIYDKAKMLRNHGRSNKFQSDFIGYNSRLDALQAAILDVKLKHLEEWTDMRIKNAKIYTELLQDSEVVVPASDANCKSVFHLYVVRVKNRDRIINKLKEQGIGAGIHYPEPLHTQNALKYLIDTKQKFPVAEKICSEIVSLPMFPELKKEEIEFVCDTLLDATKR
ncbi:MAG: DegT/DnrJ/EryC1/StrS family aminotransferase [Candidatus Diapherotrites archaeon]